MALNRRWDNGGYHEDSLPVRVEWLHANPGNK
jgi:hypothetical protein